MRKAVVIIILLTITFGFSSYAQEKTFKDGTVWNLQFVKLKTGQGDSYLNSLKGTWKAVHDEAVKQGLILSYKILLGNASNPEDWDVLLMTEYKNLASMEGNDEKWDAIQAKFVGNADEMKKLNEKRVDMRSIYGSRVIREVIYK